MITIFFIKEKLITTLVNIALDWELPFELKFDATDFAVGVMLGQQNDKYFYAIYYAIKDLN